MPRPTLNKIRPPNWIITTSSARRSTGRYPESIMLRAFAIHLLAQASKVLSNIADSCVFCKVLNDEAKATIVYRDELVTAFRDIHPAAPTHILIVPNRHIHSLNEMQPEDESLVGHMVFTARQIAAQENIAA